MRRRTRSHLLRETAEGFRLVFGHRVLRSIALLVFSVDPLRDRAGGPGRRLGGATTPTEGSPAASTRA